MVFPWIPIGIAGATIASTLYSGIQSRNASRYSMDYQKNLKKENDLFWENYRKNHNWKKSRKILYPYRAGYYFNESSFYNANASYNSSFARNIGYTSAALGGLYSTRLRYAKFRFR